MSEGSTQFRGTAFGGFNRQDVLNYLKKVEEEHERLVSELRSELDELKHNRNDDRRRLEELEGQLHEVQAGSEALQETLERVETDLEAKSEALLQLEQELGFLRAATTELEPKAAAYNRLKERTAAIELDAHERAQVTMDRAKAEIAQIKQECLNWVGEIRDGYDRLRNDLGSALAHSSNELERIGQMFQRVSQEFDDQEATVREILERAEAVSVEPEEEALLVP